MPKGAGLLSPITAPLWIEGSATKDGLPIVPTVVGGLVTFPTIAFVDATAAVVTILYSFDVRVINGTHVPNFIENNFLDL